MWKAHKLAQAVYKNPKGTPPFVLQKAVDAYREIIKAYPGSLFAVQAEFSIGHLYLVKGDFDKARDVYKNLTTDCDKKGNLCAEGYFAIGKSYELQGRWAEALLIYKKIMQEYPFSAKSLDLPLYIIRHYRAEKNEMGLKSAADQGVAYYLGLKTQERGQKGAHILQSLITRCYLESGMWQDALDSLERYVRDYPDRDPQEAIFVKALLYARKLNDKQKAKEELERIVKDYPDSKLAPQAKTLLGRL